MRIDCKTKRIIHIVFDISLSLMLVATGIAFAVSCYAIYTSAETQMFTYESIGAAFDKIDVLVYITLAFVVVGAGLSLLLPLDKEEPRAGKNPRATCLRLQRLADLSLAPEEDRVSICKERKVRRGLCIAFIVLAVLEAGLPLIYLLNTKHFPALPGAYNSEVLHGMLVYLAMLLPIAVYTIVAFFFVRRSYRRETEALKNALKAGAKADPAAKVDESRPMEKIQRFFCDHARSIGIGTRAMLLVCAVGFIIAGVVNGGMRDVLVKAVNICAECIGLG